MNKTEIVEKAIELANANGLENLSVAGLAKEFNVKPPSLYKHIASLRDLIDELGIICQDRLIQITRTNCFGLSGDDALVEFCRSSRKFALQNPGLYQSMQLTHIKRSNRYRQTAETLLAMLAALFSPYNIKRTSLIHTIRHFRCLLHGFIDLELKEGFGLPEDIEKSFELAIRQFIFTLNHYTIKKKRQGEIR